MSGNSISAPSVSGKEFLTGIQVMLLSNFESYMLPVAQSVDCLFSSYWGKMKEAKTAYKSKPLLAIDKASDVNLCDMFIDIYLQNPYWSEFRILNFFCKRGISMTMEKLQYLRKECCLESKDDVCHKLMRLYAKKEIQLDKRQIQFIERVNPAFRDRDFRAARPGDLLIYGCIFFRRLNKMFYLHVVVDLFNGYVFGKVSRRRSGEIGIKMLQDKIAPFYKDRGYVIGTVIHSSKSARDRSEVEECKIHEGIMAMGLEWLEPHREFGIIQCFQRDVLDRFFYEAEALKVSLFMIQPALDRWMIQYNAACPFHQRRNLLGYLEFIENKECM